MGKDPWVHGIAQNAPALNQFLHFSYSQGLLSRQPRLEELFVDLGNAINASLPLTEFPIPC